MAKRCLNCGKVSDNNLYACSACLDKINEARRDIELKRRFKKETMGALNKIMAVFILVIVFITVCFTLFVLNRLRLPLEILFNILFLSLVGFLIYFFVGTILVRYCSKLSLKVYSDKNYYTQRPIERLRDIRLLKESLKFISLLCLLILLSWFIFACVGISWDLVYKLKLSESLLRLRGIVINGFAQAGFLLGLIAPLNKYLDWIKGLEK